MTNSFPFIGHPLVAMVVLLEAFLSIPWSAIEKAIPFLFSKCFLFDVLLEAHLCLPWNIYSTPVVHVPWSSCTLHAVHRSVPSNLGCSNRFLEWASRFQPTCTLVCKDRILRFYQLGCSSCSVAQVVLAVRSFLLVRCCCCFLWKQLYKARP